MTPPAWRAAAEGLRAILVPPEMAQLSAEGRARLLRMTFRSVRYSISTIPGLSVPLVLFAMYRGGTAWPLLWTAFYLGLTALVWWLWRRFVQDEARLTPADLLAKWRPPLDRLALLHGLGVGSAVLLTLALPSYEFAVLLHMVLVGITAACVTHQTALLGVFLRYLLASWGLILLHVTRSFPEPWPYRLVLGLLFVLGLYRHTVAAHRFVFEQLRLEEHSQELSRHLGAAKEAAEVALQDRNRFLSTASHDLRQPLHAMGMLVAALQARIFAPGYRAARAATTTWAMASAWPWSRKRRRCWAWATACARGWAAARASGCACGPPRRRPHAPWPGRRRQARRVMGSPRPLAGVGWWSKTSRRCWRPGARCCKAGALRRAAS